MIFLSSSQGMTTTSWVTLCFFVISIIAIVCSSILIKILINKRKDYRRGFEAFGNKKYRYNMWNLWVVVFLCFTGVIGALISGSIFFGSL